MPSFKKSSSSRRPSRSGRSDKKSSSRDLTPSRSKDRKSSSKSKLSRREKALALEKSSRHRKPRRDYNSFSDEDVSSEEEERRRSYRMKKDKRKRRGHKERRRDRRREYSSSESSTSDSEEENTTVKKIYKEKAEEGTEKVEAVQEGSLEEDKLTTSEEATQQDVKSADTNNAESKEAKADEAAPTVEDEAVVNASDVLEVMGADGNAEPGSGADRRVGQGSGGDYGAAYKELYEQLCSRMVHRIMRFFYELYAKTNQEKLFKRRLVEIQRWNQDQINKVAKGFVRNHKDIIRVFRFAYAADVLVMSVVVQRDEESRDVEVECPNFSDFCHRCFIETARNLFDHSGILDPALPPSQKMQVHDALYLSVSRAIASSLRMMVPIHKIAPIKPEDEEQYAFMDQGIDDGLDLSGDEADELGFGGSEGLGGDADLKEAEQQGLEASEESDSESGSDGSSSEEGSDSEEESDSGEESESSSGSSIESDYAEIQRLQRRESDFEGSDDGLGFM